MAQEGSLELEQGCEDTNDDGLTPQGVAYELARKNRIAGNHEVMRSVFGPERGCGQGAPGTGKARQKEGDTKKEKREEKASKGEGERRKSTRTKVLVNGKPVDETLGDGGISRDTRGSGIKVAGEVKGVGENGEGQLGKGCEGVRGEMIKLLARRTVGKETTDFVWKGWGDDEGDEEDKRRQVEGRARFKEEIVTTQKVEAVMQVRKMTTTGDMTWFHHDVSRSCEGNERDESPENEHREVEKGRRKFEEVVVWRTRYKEDVIAPEFRVVECWTKKGDEEMPTAEKGGPLLAEKGWKKKRGGQSSTAEERGKQGLRSGSAAGGRVSAEVQGMGVGTEVEGPAVCEYLSGRAREDQW